MKIMTRQLGIPTIDHEPRRAAAGTASLLAPLDLEFGGIDLELSQSIRSNLTEQLQRTAPTILEVLENGFTLWPDVDTALDLTAIASVRRFKNRDQLGFGDVHLDFLVHSHLITHSGIKVNRYFQSLRLT